MQVSSPRQLKQMLWGPEAKSVVQAHQQQEHWSFHWQKYGNARQWPRTTINESLATESKQPDTDNDPAVYQEESYFDIPYVSAETLGMALFGQVPPQFVEKPSDDVQQSGRCFSSPVALKKSLSGTSWQPTTLAHSKQASARHQALALNNARQQTAIKKYAVDSCEDSVKEQIVQALCLQSSQGKFALQQLETLVQQVWACTDTKQLNDITTRYQTVLVPQESAVSSRPTLPWKVVSASFGAGSVVSGLLVYFF